MPAAARITDSITGTTAWEHSGHTDDDSHGALPITGTISAGCSGDVFINGLAAAYAGSVTTEKDDCCGSSSGSVAEGSGTVFINGNPAARLGDALNAHNGTGSISSGSSDVFIGD